MKDKRDVWQYRNRTHNYAAYLNVGGEPVKAAYYDLYLGLFHNPSCIDGVLEYADNKLQKDISEKGENNLSDHSFCTGCLKVSGAKDNIMDAVMHFAKEYPNKDHQEVIRNLLDQLLEDVDTYYISVYGKHRQNEARQEAAGFIRDLMDLSELYQEAKKDNSEYYIQWSTQIDAFLEKLS